MAQRVKTLTSIHEDVGPIPCLASMRIRRCCEVQCRLPMWLGSEVAVAVAQAHSCSSNLTPAQELPYAAEAALKKFFLIK